VPEPDSTTLAKVGWVTRNKSAAARMLMRVLRLGWPAIICAAFIGLLSVFSPDYREIFTHILSEALWVALIFLVFVWPRLVIFAEERERLLQFFGIDAQQPKITIYLSNLHIKAGGAEGLETTTRGHTGEAISKVEYDAAMAMGAKLRGVAGILPEWLHALASHLSFAFLPVRISVELSPRDQDWPRTRSMIETGRYETSGTLVILGSPIYNSISKYFIEEVLRKRADYRRYIGFDRETTAERRRYLEVVYKGPPENHVPQPHGPDDHVGAMMRFKHDGRIVFLCAGIEDWSTAASAGYALTHWKEIAKLGALDEGLAFVFRCEQGWIPEYKYPVETMGWPAAVDRGR
jgi:hypothetical protein